jgi:hypothetical protein
MATLETLLCGVAILAVALRSHGTTLVLGGLAALGCSRMAGPTEVAAFDKLAGAGDQRGG